MESLTTTKHPILIYKIHCWDNYTRILILHPLIISTKNISDVKKLWSRLGKGCGGKGVKSKGEAKVCVEITFKILIPMTQATIYPCRDVLRPGSSLPKILMWSTAFLHRPCLPPFDFTSFHQFFSSFGHKFFTARVFLVGFFKFF